MSEGPRVRFLLTLFSSGLSLIWGDMQSFKCFDNGLGRTPGLAGFMSAGQAARLPDVHGVSVLHCLLLCLKYTDTCTSFAYHDGRCYLRNITLAHPGLLCGINVLEGRVRCPADRIGDAFVAFGGANRIMLECMCGIQNNVTLQWNYLPEVSYYDCVDQCSSLPCFVKLGADQKCWVCDGNCDYCRPYKDSSPTYPQRVGCMPIN